MDKRILEAMSALAEADAIMYASDVAYNSEIASISGDMELLERALSAFYATWGKVKEAKSILNELTKGMNFSDEVD